MKRSKSRLLVCACSNKALGSNHTSRLRTVNNFGVLNWRIGRLGDTKGLFAQALLGYEKALGLGHTLTLKTVKNLWRLNRTMRRLEDAERMHQWILTSEQKSNGEEDKSFEEAVKL